MLDDIHWLGHDSFRLRTSLAASPCTSTRGSCRQGTAADAILVTHEHYDHLSLDDIDKIAGPGTVVVGPASVTGQLGGLETVTVAAGDRRGSPWPAGAGGARLQHRQVPRARPALPPP